LHTASAKKRNLEFLILLQEKYQVRSWGSMNAGKSLLDPLKIPASLIEQMVKEGFGFRKTERFSMNRGIKQ
jgi:hypothetical protein